MNKIEAKILLENLLSRVASLDDGTKELTGKLTERELEAINYALSIMGGLIPVGLAAPGSVPSPQSDVGKVKKTPLEEVGEMVVQQEEEKNAVQESENLIELDTTVLEEKVADIAEVRLCLDFGTAMSKATLVQNDDDVEDIHVLKLGIPGDQEEISETMLVSSVYIDNDGLLWFGQNAVARSQIENQDGKRRRLDNIKRWLSEEGFDDKVSEHFNPTDISIRYSDMIQAYLMYLTWAVNHSLEELDHSRNIPRRFAMPIFEGVKKHETISRLRKMLGDAQILADTFFTILQDGIPLEDYMNASSQLDSMKNEYSFVAEDLTEPLGVAGSLLSWRSRINSLVMVIDVGAGTSDFSMFKISYDPDTSVSGSREVTGSAMGITEAGNHLDTLLNGYVLKKAGVTSDDPMYINLLGALILTIRDYKEALFNDGFVSISLFNNEVVDIELDEFLALEQVKKFSETLKNTMVGILESVDISWIKSAPEYNNIPTLAVALTGGGSDLPMVKELANCELTIKGNHLRLVESIRFPKWLDEEGYDELEEDYPRIAVSLGGARKNIISHGGEAALTAGDVKGTPVIGGYYTKGV